MKALLIIDMQRDFMPGAPLEIPGINNIIPIINALHNKFELVFATQDWHPENHISFYVWPKHCVQNTEGARLCEELNAGKIIQTFRKGMSANVDAYCPFYDNNRNIIHPNANTILRQSGVTDLYICGVALDYCVKSTCFAAKYLGFNVSLIIDATRKAKTATFCKESEAKLYYDMVREGINIIHSNTLL